MVWTLQPSHCPATYSFMSLVCGWGWWSSLYRIICLLIRRKTKLSTTNIVCCVSLSFCQHNCQVLSLKSVNSNEGCTHCAVLQLWVNKVSEKKNVACAMSYYTLALSLFEFNWVLGTCIERWWRSNAILMVVGVKNAFFSNSYSVCAFFDNALNYILLCFKNYYSPISACASYNRVFGNWCSDYKT